MDRPALFGLSPHDLKFVETIPPPLAQPAVLENRLTELQQIRQETFRRMRSRTVNLVDRARYQADLLAVNSAIQTTVLRLRAAGAMGVLSNKLAR